MVLNLRQGLAREFLEIGIRAFLDLVAEQRSVPFLVLDLPVHIVTVECATLFRL